MREVVFFLRVMTRKKKTHSTLLNKNLMDHFVNCSIEIPVYFLPHLAILGREFHLAWARIISLFKLPNDDVFDIIDVQKMLSVIKVRGCIEIFNGSHALIDPVGRHDSSLLCLVVIPTEHTG